MTIVDATKENTRTVDTDLEKLKALLTGFGVNFEVDDTDVLVYEGYCGFYTAFTFNSEGKFVAMGAYE